MIDLPDFGYTSCSVHPLDPGGAVPGTLGGPTDYLSRPGYRFAVTYQLRELHSADDARKLQALLEQGSQQDVSYPWPLDYRPPAALNAVAAAGGYTHPLVNGAVAAGGVLAVHLLAPRYAFRLGQPIAVIDENGMGYIHKVAQPIVADAGGFVSLPVFPWTRRGFLDGSLVEVDKPRIRGMLTFDGTTQPAYGRRAFNFTITERR